MGQRSKSFVRHIYLQKKRLWVIQTQELFSSYYWLNVIQPFTSVLYVNTGLIDPVPVDPLSKFHIPASILSVSISHSRLHPASSSGVLLALYGEEGAGTTPAHLPGDEDLQGAAQAIVRLQHVYRWNIYHGRAYPFQIIIDINCGNDMQEEATILQ